MAYNNGTDVVIGGEFFALRSYQRSTTDDLVARFGSAEKGQSNLDLMKAATQKTYRGGQFQRTWVDDEMASTIQNAYYNKLDDQLYFTPDYTKYTSTSGMDQNGASTWCTWKDRFLYIAYRLAAPSSGNVLKRIDLTTGAELSITLPTAVLNAACPITSMVVHKDAIFFCGATWGSTAGGTSQFNIHRLNPNDQTIADIGGVTYRLYTFRDSLYLITHLNIFFSARNEFSATATYDVLRQSVGSNGSPPQVKGAEYNNALYLPKEDGLYRFDGVSINPVIDYRSKPSPDNFRSLTVFNGKLYYTMKNKLFSFNGITIDELKDFSNGYAIQHVEASIDRLWILARSDTSVQGTDIFNKNNSATYNHSLFCFNGVGFYEYREANLPRSQNVSPKVFPVGSRLSIISPDMYLNASNQLLSNGYLNWTINTENEFTVTNIGTARSFTVYGSEFDGGYPSVTKTLCGVMIDASGFDNTNIVLSVQCRYFTEGSYTGFLEVWNSQNVDVNAARYDYYLHDQSTRAFPELETSPQLFERLQYKIIATIKGNFVPTIAPSLKSVTFRYTLQPRPRRKWLLTIPAYGHDTRGISPAITGHNSVDNRPATFTRNFLYRAFEQKLPILFYDVDLTTLKSINSPTSITVNGTFLFNHNDHVAIYKYGGGWINRRVRFPLYDLSLDQTELTYDLIGHRLGLGAIESSLVETGVQVRKSYAVYVTKIMNERYILDDNTLATVNGHTDLPSDITIELVEL